MPTRRAAPPRRRRRAHRTRALRVPVPAAARRRQPIQSTPAPAARRRADPVKGVRLMQPTHTILLAEEDAAVRVVPRRQPDRRRLPRARRRRPHAARSSSSSARSPTSSSATSTARRSTCSTPSATPTASPSRIDPDVPLIVLTARADELARVRYLDRGCDDVLGKPFSYPELRGRIRALLRRSQRAPARAASTRVGALRIDHAARQVQRRRHARRACRRRSTRCSRTSPPSRRACSPATSCCATSGATGRPAGPSTATLSPARIGALAVLARGSVRRVGDALSPAVWIARSPRS